MGGVREQSHKGIDGALAAAPLSYWVIELPFLRFKDNLSRAGQRRLKTTQDERAPGIVIDLPNP
jgi:hypothetical protein